MGDLGKLPMNIRAAISGRGIECKIHEHKEFLMEIVSPQDFATALGYPVQRITKTLFLRSDDAQVYAVAVCSINRRLNFKSVADAVGLRCVEMASPEELHAKTGYPRNGVSPLGLAGDITVVMDSSLFDYPTVLIGGGISAIEIEISPAGLENISRAKVRNITA